MRMSSSRSRARSARRPESRSASRASSNSASTVSSDSSTSSSGVRTSRSDSVGRRRRVATDSPPWCSRRVRPSASDVRRMGCLVLTTNGASTNSHTTTMSTRSRELDMVGIPPVVGNVPGCSRPFPDLAWVWTNVNPRRRQCGPATPNLSRGNHRMSGGVRAPRGGSPANAAGAGHSPSSRSFATTPPATSPSTALPCDARRSRSR